MPCAFELDRSQYSRKSEGAETRCQFNVQEAELIELEGKTWCLFHLPLTQKENWTKEEKSRFLILLTDYSDNRARHNTNIDLSGVIFPHLGSISSEQVFGKNPPDLLVVNASFNNDVICHDVNFNGRVIFDGSCFGKLVDFSKSNFSNRVSFRGVRFESRSRFENCAFHEYTDFSKSSFIETTSFVNSKFGSKASFIGSKFEKFVDFSRSGFSRQVEFQESVFSGSADFLGVTFSRTADFSMAQFYRASRFPETEFHGDAEFSSSEFLESVYFSDSSFYKKANFERSKFEGDAHFSASRIGDAASGVTFYEVSFKDAVFSNRARFVNRRFLDTSDFRDTVFHIAPEFYSCALHQDTDFTGAEFLDTKGTDEVNAAQAYRTLKLAMESVRSRSDQARFYALEQQSLRALSNTSRAENVISWLYEKTADYGTSIAGPLAWLFAIFAVFVGAYLLAVALDGGTGIADADLQVVVRYTLRQVFRPFEAFSHRGTAPIAPLGLAIWSAVYSLLNFSLLALFFLAVRRRFKMD